MTKPPLYSRSGNISPIMGSDAINSTDALGLRRDEASLLEEAQQFSIVAVRHVEEVRQALVGSADTQTWLNHRSSNAFGRRNGAELAAAFEDLTAVYGKLSTLKWDAVRVEFEERHRSSQQARARFAMPPLSAPFGTSTAIVDERLPVMPVAEAGAHPPMSRGVNDDPWQENGANPHEWIAEAFLNGAASPEDDEAGDTFPVHEPPASLNAAADPFLAISPPGFSAEEAEEVKEAAVELGGGSAHAEPTVPTFTSVPAASSHVNTDAADQQREGSTHAKPTLQSSTSTPSDVSSLNGNIDDNDSHNDEDVKSEWEDSDTSSSSEALPSRGNFDYLYKGGYAMQVSGGKETRGVVPKTVKRVVVDPSVRVIEEGAFQGCNLLTTITVPSTVEAVGDNAFRKCSKLKNVVFLTKAPKARRRKKVWTPKRDEKKEEPPSPLPPGPPSAMRRRSSLRSIGEWAFFNCSSLANMQLPHGLESIGPRAFQRCSSMRLAHGKLPETLARVGDNAFNGCPPQTKAAFERWEKESRLGAARNNGHEANIP